MNINKLSKRKSNNLFKYKKEDVILFLKKRLLVEEVETFLIHSLCYLTELHNKKRKTNSRITFITTDYSLILSERLISEVEKKEVNEELVLEFLNKIEHSVHELSMLLISYAQTIEENIDTNYYYEREDKVYNIKVIVK